MKTNKSYGKRLKVTRNGKVIARKPGQNHFNAGESRSRQLKKKGTQQLAFNRKNRARFLSNI